MSSQQGKYVISKLSCPECGAMISENNILGHWRLHLPNESEGQSTQPILGCPLTQQQRSAPTDPSLEELVMGNRMPSTPSDSSSIMSLATESIQYAAAARALLKRTECYTKEGLMAFLAAKYPEIPEEHRHSLIIGAVTGAQTAAQLYVLLDGAKSGSDKGSQVMSEGARRMLSFYNLGLTSEGPFVPSPRVHLSPKLPTSSEYQEPQEEEEPEMLKYQHHRRIPVVKENNSRAMRMVTTPKRRHVPSSSLDLRSLVPNSVINKTRSPE